ncbi:hypothetical protein CCM_06497 [Cordyceps militaris CM01]|uniref:Uncharacterized protein n=1 Tax=Cordyceps militaris (strain CM01) TaxID=983644 RepID=G3JMP1_CORMM|nr:uncharacterized protein CCM_06497 [Cordyceps militaris CM01]EGX90077.1 hypothetical protein CCM_06497 [Cordyceps militaris CM01]
MQIIVFSFPKGCTSVGPETFLVLIFCLDSLLLFSTHQLHLSLATRSTILGLLPTFLCVGNWQPKLNLPSVQTSGKATPDCRC